MTCPTCQNAISLLSEISARVRSLPPEKQTEFRQEILLRYGALPRPN
jgi:hypothetical protein